LNKLASSSVGDDASALLRMSQLLRHLPLRLASVLLATGLMRPLAIDAAPVLPLRTNDVIAFLGGANVVAAQQSGHLETLLTLAEPGLRLRFRSLAWEGDTVFSRPRELNYPTSTDQLHQLGATVAVLRFGRTEALAGEARLPAFIQAYDQLLTDCATVASRLVVVAPPAFENTGDPNLPNLTEHNADLGRYAEALRGLAAKHSATFVDLLGELRNAETGRLTNDGWQWTPAGEARVAAAFVRQLGFGDVVLRAGSADAAGAWSGATFEGLRRAVVTKNELWFRYSRPMNWAFLAGDRTDQPSSRDHRDRTIRWFPSEMEQFKPLIADAEQNIDKLAQKATESATR
jgi:hypothetical protein